MTAARGKTSEAIGLVRNCLADVLASEGWRLQGADNAVSAWNALATPGKLGSIVTLWTGETIVEQAEASLVTDLAFSVWICARRHEQDNGARRQAQAADDLAASEAHDRIKAALLGLDVSPVGAGPQDIRPVYQGSSQLSTPDGIPIDGIEQRWAIRIAAQGATAQVEG